MTEPGVANFPHRVVFRFLLVTLYYMPRSMRAATIFVIVNYYL